MSFEEFYKKYTSMMFCLSKSNMTETVMIKEELNELCNQYPDYEEAAMDRIWQEVNRA